jgi:hypothetical protein
VVLKPEVLARSTFCFSDSHLGPADVGTIDAFESVLAALLEEAARTRRVLGVDGMDVSTLTRVLLEGPALAALPARALDEYIEAQVHGPVALARDVEALVIDPSFDGTSTGAVLAAIANRHGLPLRRHAGFALPVDQVPEAFRGPAIPPLARRVQATFAAPDALIDAALIGVAARSAVTEPEAWADRGPLDDTLQHLKQLWHVLVQYGHPAARQ